MVDCCRAGSRTAAATFPRVWALARPANPRPAPCKFERMIEDFLDMAKIEAGKLDLRLEIRDARMLASEVVYQFEGVSPRHQLTLSLPERVVPVRCDGLR